MKTDRGTAMARRKRYNIFAVAVMLVFLYVPSRLFVLCCVEGAGTDTELYARYAYVHRLASERRLSFHRLYRDMGLTALAGGGTGAFDSLALTVVAYPPLAVAAMTLPAFFLRGECADIQEFTASYRKAFRFLCAAAEAAGVAAVCLLMLFLYGNGGTITLVFRISIMILAGMLMPRLLYDRLDVILGALMALSLALLAGRATLLSFFTFALAVNFKLIPLFLFPVWALGACRAADIDGPSPRARAVRLAGAAIRNGALLFLCIAGVALFFCAIEGRGVFDYLAFHLGRGVHIESLWGTLSLAAARLSGASTAVILSSGAYNVPASALAALAFPVMAGLLTVVSVMAAGIALGRRQPASPPEPGAVVESSLLFLCIVYVFSPVFSPQYLLTLIPFVALLPYSGRGAFVLSCVFIGVCGLSTLIYPYFYSRAILQGPSWFGLFLLSARMLLLAGMAGILFMRQAAGLKIGGRS